MRKIAPRCIALVLAVAGCSLEPDAPALYLSPSDPPGATASLWWLPPTRGAYSGFEVEMRKGEGAFEPIASTAADGAAAQIYLPSELEGTDVQFRVRALPGSRSRRLSNVVTHRRGVDTPGLRLSSGPETGAVTLHVPITTARLILERRAIDCLGVATPWTELPLTAGAVTYRDVDLGAWSDGAVLEYRLSAVRGNVQSEPSTRATYAAQVLPPTSLTATSAPGGTLITVQNGSRCAVMATVHPGASLLVLGEVPLAAGPGALGEVLVASPPPETSFYSAESRLAAGQAPQSLRTWVLAPGAVPPGWEASLPALPRSALAARLPSGAFALLRADRTAVHAPTDSGPDPLVLDPAVERVCGLRADRAGRVHVLLLDLTTPLRTLVHALHDGVAWTRETLATNESFAYQCAVSELALDGSLLVAWVSGFDVLVSSWKSGVRSSWTFPNAYPRFASRLLLAGDDRGNPHLVIRLGATATYWRLGTGGAESEPVPVDPFELHGLMATQTGLSLVYPPPTGLYAVAIIDRGANGWGVPSEVFAGNAPGWSIHVASSNDGSRQAVGSAAGARLWLRDASGTTEVQWPSLGGDFALGFGTAGKAWVLDGLQGAWSTGDLPAVLFEEQ